MDMTTQQPSWSTPSRTPQVPQPAAAASSGIENLARSIACLAEEVTDIACDVGSLRTDMTTRLDAIAAQLAVITARITGSGRVDLGSGHPGALPDG
jgi:hypothetical protein